MRFSQDLPGKSHKWFLESPAGDSGFHQGSHLHGVEKESAEVGEVFLGEGNLGYVVRQVRAPFRTPIDHDLLIVILIFGNRDFGSSVAKSARSRKSLATATLGTAILDEMSFPNQVLPPQNPRGLVCLRKSSHLRRLFPFPTPGIPRYMP